MHEANKEVYRIESSGVDYNNSGLSFIRSTLRNKLQLLFIKVLAL